jgi:hypothetical protein
VSSVNCDNIGRAGMFASLAPRRGPMKQGHQAIVTRSIERVRSAERRTVSGPHLAAKASRDTLN